MRDGQSDSTGEQSVEGSHAPLELKAGALLELARSQNVGSGNLAAALSEITEAAARALEVERASVWLYSPDKSEIRCIDLYQATQHIHSDGIVLQASHYPRYFDALKENRAIPADDAHTDWRTREFSEGYLTPLGINSMLDAPIHVRGEMVGVVCHEHVGPARRWSFEERGFAGSIADYTALAMQASDLARSNTQLQREIEVRVKTEAELERARAAAEDANRAKSVFLANLSHELRTPLNSIIGFSELLRERVEPPLVKKLEIIETAGRTLLSMINELLEMASLEAGLATLEWQTFDLRSFLEPLVTDAATVVAAKGNRFHQPSDIPSVPMKADSDKLWRLLWNLVENANKFTTDGSIWFDVSSDEKEIRFSIRDDGQGIPPELMETIFQPFVQADGSLRRRYGGAGLGLAITRRLCDLMGGRIAAESSVGGGSSFNVFLPVAMGG